MSNLLTYLPLPELDRRNIRDWLNYPAGTVPSDKEVALISGERLKQAADQYFNDCCSYGKSSTSCTYDKLFGGSGKGGAT